MDRLPSGENSYDLVEDGFRGRRAWDWQRFDDALVVDRWVDPPLNLELFKI